MEGAEGFEYVDFASKALPGFRNRVVRLPEVRELARRYAETDCFCTYFLFDRGLAEHVKGNGRSVSGYAGACYATYLPLDVDSEDPAVAAKAAGQIARYVLDRWGAPEEAVPVYYSGSKGYHVCLATELFGEVEPGRALPTVFKRMRQELVRYAHMSNADAVDFSISDRLRLLRLPNTRNTKSGLYKVPLSAEELLAGDPEYVAALARKPRQPWLTDETGLVPRYGTAAIAEAEDLFTRCSERAEAERERRADLSDPGTFLGNGDVTRALCEAEQRLYRDGVAQGFRSGVCLRLASRFRSAGFEEEQAGAFAGAFAARCRPPLPDDTARRIVSVAYRANGRGYQFGCGTGNGDAAHTRPVYEACPYPDRMECGVYQAATANGSAGNAHTGSKS